MNHQTKTNRILLVSNDFTVRESLGEILQAGGYAVLPVENGRQAVEALRAIRIGAIVLDHGTPFGPKEVGAGTPNTLAALTDMDPFLPLVLTCDEATELDYASSLMADLVLKHPIASKALLEGVDTVLTETLRERVHRKSDTYVLQR